MSDYRIGIVVEGTTDRIVIESALNKIFNDHTYTLTQLQPELSDGLSKGGFGSTGGGWGGVNTRKNLDKLPVNGIILPKSVLRLRNLLSISF